MNDLRLLDHFGPQASPLPPSALDAARRRLDQAVASDSVVRLDPRRAHTRGRRMRSLAAVAATVAVGLAVVPGLVRSDSSVALAAVDPLAFPLSLDEPPAGLDGPVVEHEPAFWSARYGAPLDGMAIVTGVDDREFWTVPEDAEVTDVAGREALVYDRAVRAGTAASAPAVTILWATGGVWTAVTGAGRFADADEVEAVAESLREEPTPVDLSLDLAPQGWSLTAYHDDRSLTLTSRDGETSLTVALVDRLDDSLAAYGAHEVSTARVDDRPARIGRVEGGSAEPGWVLEARTATGRPFSLQAPGTLTREQVLRVAAGVTYRR